MNEHGIGIKENPTQLTIPQDGTSAIQFIVGAAPVNLLDDPYSVTNVPILAARRAEADAALGFSYDWGRCKEDRSKFMYTLCQSVYASFNLSKVSPVILLNVLDPEKHKKVNQPATLKVVNSEAVLEVTGVLRDKTEVTSSGNKLIQDEDYILSFDDDGYLKISLTDQSVSDITVNSTSIDPSLVTRNDVIGGYDIKSGKNSGLECIEDVFQLHGVVPGLVVCPGWSSDPVVAAAMEMKCTGINGVFRCECVADLDSSKAVTYSLVRDVKEENGLSGTHTAVVWPKVRAAGMDFYYSAVFAAMTAAADIENGDIPYKSPSNKNISISALVLDDEKGTEILLPQDKANIVNSYGVITAVKFITWKSWGNTTAAYPGTTDPKDRWFACRRMFSFCENHWILSYYNNVDDPVDLRLTQTVLENENMWYSSLFAQGKIAGGSVTFDSSENPASQILDGKIIFGIKVAFFPPAQYIEGKFEFDPSILSAYFAS